MNRTRDSRRSLASGGLILSIAMLVANAANYGVNALTGRWFDEQGFADASLMVTVFLLLTVAAVALQLMAGRRIGMGGEAAPVVGWLRRNALFAGAAVGAAIAGPAMFWQTVFSTSSALPFVFLGIGIPLYFALAVDRGVLQGELRFVALAVTFVVEAAIRLVATGAFAAMGFGATGVAAALSVSTTAAWVTGRRCARTTISAREPSAAERAAILGLVGPTSILLAGQVVINNADVLIVKAFRPTEAAAYAAVALIGRAVFFCSWSVVTTIFPVAARTDGPASSGRVTVAGAAIVAVAGLAMTAGAALFGEQLLATVVGPGYGRAAPLLWRYALATTGFTVANLLATVDLARGVLRGPVLVVVGAIAQTCAVLFSASSLDRVVDAQLTVMAILALAMIADHVRRAGQTSIRYPMPRTVRTKLAAPLRSIFLRRLAT